ncbi:hypothetical protein CEXT_266351 [Caerostris extrusa]|uniref:Uncharacterized protein n=1 Tax=Caerostris extrusa TaxID=172846 RepID=A0AAV4QJ05_CAEEX|nr:hypothetical protein CEXT_266351 [Caerostris extrusa]
MSPLKSWNLNELYRFSTPLPPFRLRKEWRRRQPHFFPNASLQQGRNPIRLPPDLPIQPERSLQLDNKLPPSSRLAREKNINFCHNNL